MDEIERTREARDRRSVLNELALPPSATYYRWTLRRLDATHNSIEQAEVLPDGQTPILEPAFPMTTRAGTVVWDFEAARTVALYGVDESWDTAIAARASVPLWASSPGGAGLPLWSLGPGARPFPFIVPRYTARWRASPLLYELRWHPDGAWTEGLVETQHRSTDAERAEVYAGRAALLKVAARKQRGDGIPPLEDFLTRLEQALPDQAAPDGTVTHGLGGWHDVTKRAVADAVGIGISTLDDRIAWYRESRGVDLDWMTRLRPALRAWRRGLSFLALLGVDTPGKPGFSGRPAGGR